MGSSNNDDEKRAKLKALVGGDKITDIGQIDAVFGSRAVENYRMGNQEFEIDDLEDESLQNAITAFEGYQERKKVSAEKEEADRKKAEAERRKRILALASGGRGDTILVNKEAGSAGVKEARKSGRL